MQESGSKQLREYTLARCEIETEKGRGFARRETKMWRRLELLADPLHEFSKRHVLHQRAGGAGLHPSTVLGSIVERHMNV